MAFDALYKQKVPIYVGELKENIGMESLANYLRGYKMYLSRFSYFSDGEELTSRIGYLTCFTNRCGLYYDTVLEKVVVLDIYAEEKDPNGNLIKVSGRGDNTSYKKKNLVVGKDVIILNGDTSTIPPFIYLKGIIDKVLHKEDIINQQDNMLLKPILISGQGENFDNMANTMKNILSGVAFINTKGKKKGNTVMENLGTEVLNLQMNNAYKGKELWESRDKTEALMFDYLGYPRVNGDKKERMIESEVNTAGAFAKANYLCALETRKRAIDAFNKISPKKIELVENISWESEEEDDHDKEDKVEGTDKRQNNSNK